MATSTPIATLGRDAKIAEGVQAHLHPEYDVVHTCFDVESAEAEFPLICSGQLDAPCKSGLGSNAGKPPGERRVPTIVYFGGGVSDEECERLTAAVSAKAPGARFVRVTRDEVLAAGAKGPQPDVIAKIFRDKAAGL